MGCAREKSRVQPFGPLLINHEGEDSFQTDRGVVVGIDAYVVAAQVLAALFQVVVGVMMLVAVEMDGAFPALVPVGERIMAEDEKLVPSFHFGIVFDPREGPGVRLPVRAVDETVVIAADQVFLPAQLAQYLIGSVGTFKGDVTQNVDFIVRLDDIVPVADELLIHLVGIGKRPLTVRDNFVMKKVQIRCKENHRQLLSGKDTFIIHLFAFGYGYYHNANAGVSFKLGQVSSERIID